MPVFEVATHQNDQDFDILACGQRREVNTLKDIRVALEELPNKDYPVVEGHIDGEHVEFREFLRQLEEHQCQQ